MWAFWVLSWPSAQTGAVAWRLGVQASTGVPGCGVQRSPGPEAVLTPLLVPGRCFCACEGQLWPLRSSAPSYPRPHSMEHVFPQRVAQAAWAICHLVWMLLFMPHSAPWPLLCPIFNLPHPQASGSDATLGCGSFLACHQYRRWKTATLWPGLQPPEVAGESLYCCALTTSPVPAQCPYTLTLSPVPAHCPALIPCPSPCWLPLLAWG